MPTNEKWNELNELNVIGFIFYQKVEGPVSSAHAKC